MGKAFWGGLALGLALAGGAGSWLIYTLENEPIRFASKSIFAGKEWAYFEGSIYGDSDDAPRNNYIRGSCYRDRMECIVGALDQIAPRLIGGYFEDTLKIRKWDEREIVADSEGTDPGQCIWYEIKIDLKTDEIVYTRFPSKQSSRDCSAFVAKVMRWRIDNGKAWEQNADGSMRK